MAFKTKSKKSSGGGFVYKKRSAQSVRNRENSAGGFDAMVKRTFSIFSAKNSNHRLRIMPPTWDDASHYGFDVHVHYGIGTDRGQYLCLAKMKGEACPICEEQARANQEGDEEYAKALRANRRVGVWVIDRDKENEGPKVYLMPQRMDQDLTSASTDKRSGEVRFLDDPKDGFDMEFDKEGKGEKTRYVGVRLSHKSTPLSDSPKTARKWLDFIAENPIPDTLNYYDYEYLEKTLNGAKVKKKGRDDEEDEEEEDDEPKRKKVKTREDSKRKARDEDEDDEEEIDDEDEDLDEDDEKPRKKKRRVEGEDDEEDEDDEDEEEAPRKKKRRRDEEEEDEDDEEDEDEEPAPRKKKRKPVEDDDEEEDDEEDEEEPVRKKKRKPEPEDDEDEDEEDEDEEPIPVRKKKKRKVVEEDEDEDDDEEEDEDDEPAPRKKKRR